jgi:N-acetyl-alpha-D-glucosaminyl L-malate synthase BshA
VKRIDDVVHTFFGISQKIPSKLILIGDGPERQKAEDLGRSLGIVDRLIFLGRTREVRRVLAVSDLFLLPSEKESFGLAALEAMAAGVPVVSSNAGGLPEINQHGKTGYLADIGDVDAMVRFGLEVLSEDSVHQQFREAAFARASKFSIDKIGKRYIELYRNALSAG